MEHRSRKPLLSPSSDQPGIDVAGVIPSPISEEEKLSNVQKCLQAVKDSGISVPDTAAKEIAQGKAERLIEVFTAMSKVSSDHQRRVLGSPATAATSKLPAPATASKQRIPAPVTMAKPSPETVSKLQPKAPVAAPAASPATNGHSNTPTSKGQVTGLQAPKPTKLTIPSRKVRKFGSPNQQLEAAEGDISASAESSPEKVVADSKKLPTASGLVRNSSTRLSGSAATEASPSPSAPRSQLRKPSGIAAPSSGIATNGSPSTLQAPGSAQSKLSPKTSPRHQMVIRSYSEEPLSPGRQRKPLAAQPNGIPEQDGNKPDAKQAPASGLRMPSARSQTGPSEKVHRTMSCSTGPISSPSSSDDKPLPRLSQFERSPKLARPAHRLNGPVLGCINNTALPKKTAFVHSSDSDSSPSHVTVRSFQKHSIPPPVAFKSLMEAAPHTEASTKAETASISPVNSKPLCLERPHNLADGRSNSSSDSELKTTDKQEPAELKYSLNEQVSDMTRGDVQVVAPASQGANQPSHSLNSSGALPQKGMSEKEAEQDASHQSFSPMNIALLSLSNHTSPRHSPQSSALADMPVASPPSKSVLDRACSPVPAVAQDPSMATVKNSVQSSSPLASLPEVSPLGARDNPVRKSWRRSSNAPRGGSKPSFATASGFRAPLPANPITSLPASSVIQPHVFSPTNLDSEAPLHADVDTSAVAASLSGTDVQPPLSPEWNGQLQRGGSFTARSHSRRTQFPRRMSSDNILDGAPQQKLPGGMEHNRGGSSSDESPMGMVTNSSRAAVSFRPRSKTLSSLQHDRHNGDSMTSWDSHRDSGVSMSNNYSPHALTSSDSPTLKNFQSKKHDSSQRRPSDTSSASSSPALERYAVGAAQPCPLSSDERHHSPSPSGLVASPKRSLDGSKKSLADTKVLEARLSELEDRNSQLQNEVVNTTRAMSQLQDIIHKKDSEVSAVLQAFKTKEEELEHIYSLLRASATQPAMTTDDVPSATHRESPLVASAAANGPGNKSVTWDEASMTVAMEMERTKDKKKKPKFWKNSFKFDNLRKYKAKRTSSGSVIAGDESETNNDDVDESPLAQESTTSSQEELQRLKVELQLAKAELNRTRLNQLMEKQDFTHGSSELSAMQDSETASLQTASSMPSTGLLEAATYSASDHSGNGTMCSVFLGVGSEHLFSGQVSVGMTTSWSQLDEAVSLCIVAHAKAVDPVHGLDLSVDSVQSYSLNGIPRQMSVTSASEDDLLPDSVFESGESLKIIANLRGAKEMDCDELAYQMVVPKSTLMSYISLVEEQPVIITGSTSCGKSYLAKQLLVHILARCGVGSQAILMTTPPRDITTPAHLEAHVKKVLSHFCKRFSSESSSPLGLLIEDLDNTSCLDRQALASLRHDGERRVYVIITASRWPLSGTATTVAAAAGTSGDTHIDSSAVGSQALPATRSSMASSQCASIRLVPHNEPVKGLLSRYLNKKWLTARGGNSPPQDDMARVVEWLPSAWEHINTFLHSIVSPHAVLGPCQYLTCPGSSQETCVWFSNLWNFHILPYIIEAAAWPLAAPLAHHEWYSPVTWLHESSPWQPRRNSSAGKKSKSVAGAAPCLNLETLRQEDMVWHAQRTTPGQHSQPGGAVNLPSELLAMRKKNGMVPATVQEDRLMRLLERVVLTSSNPPTSR